MATLPYFVISPNTLMSIIGLIHGRDKTPSESREDWRKASVDVVIPAFNEEHNIALCLAALAEQTLKPRKIVLIDDGSQDETIRFAKAFAEENGLPLEAIQRHKSIGKTPTVKREARELDSDVEFILDGDTILESENYLERTVQELFQAPGVASVCGTVLPLRNKDRKAIADHANFQAFLKKVPDAPIYPPIGKLKTMMRGVSNLYRDALYMFLQKFIYHGQMYFFGSITNPVGCAVAYRRLYIKELFDTYEPILGDNLTNSEDIFIGFALVNKGYRNVQITDVYARSEEPEAQNLPRQIYLWSSSFLQSCYYFDALLRSPLKSVKRKRAELKAQKEREKQKAEERRALEPYRQRFGNHITKEQGRPMGWAMFTSLLEKIAFPTTLLILILFRNWEAIGLTMLIETTVAVTVLGLVAKGRRIEYILKGICVTPIRYSAIMYDLFTISRFAFDLWFSGNRNWKK